MYNPQLETFLCVAECGSFNKAAEKLFISPPAVIKQINLLEENLDLQLFVRTHRGLQLTEAGKSLAQDAKYIIQYCIDVIAGIFDETMLNLRRCAGLEISKEPICAAVSIHHRLAGKDRLTVQDLYGEKFMMMRREWSHYVDLLRDDLWKNHPKIQIVDFDFYDVNAFNQCENNDCVLMAVPKWQYVHPLLKILPVDWSYTIPYGLLHSPDPSPVVKQFLRAVQKETGRDK